LVEFIPHTEIIGVVYLGAVEGDITHAIKLFIDNRLKIRIYLPHPLCPLSFKGK